MPSLQPRQSTAVHKLQCSALSSGKSRALQEAQGCAAGKPAWQAAPLLLHSLSSLQCRHRGVAQVAHLRTHKEQPVAAQPLQEREGRQLVHTLRHCSQSHADWKSGSHSLHQSALHFVQVNHSFICSRCKQQTELEQSSFPQMTILSEQWSPQNHL